MIRDARPATDADGICDIYNSYVRESHCTFETEPIDSAEMARRIDESKKNGYPFLVCELDGEIAGFAHGHRFRRREAYRHSVEISVYVRPEAQRRKIAARLYEILLPELRSRGFHAVIAGIALPNEPSIRLHEKFGFVKVAHFREVGRKFDRWIDVGHWELLNN
jgi:L-amino acid N-acyltransferase YncA